MRAERQRKDPLHGVRWAAEHTCEELIAFEYRMTDEGFRCRHTLT